MGEILYYILDAPTFREKPRSLEADSGSLVTLTCEVDGNPTPDIVWIQHPIDRVGRAIEFQSTVLI